MNHLPDIPPIGPVPLEPTLTTVVILATIVLPVATAVGTLYTRDEAWGKRAALYGCAAFMGALGSWWLETWWPLAGTVLALVLMTGARWVHSRIAPTSRDGA